MLPHVCLQFIVSSANVHELRSLPALCKEVGADSYMEKLLDVYQNVGVPGVTDAIAPLYIGGVWGKYVRSGASFRMKRNSHTCSMCNNLVVRADLELALCCYDFENKFQLGKARTEDVLSHWRDLGYAATRAAGRDRATPLCRNCGEAIQR